MTNKARSNKALLADAVARGRSEDAEKYFQLVLKEYGPGPKPTIMSYNQARILFLKQQYVRAEELLAEMRVSDPSPFGFVLSIKALCEHRANKNLALLLNAQFKDCLQSYSPADSDDLPVSYYLQQSLELDEELKSWT